MNAFELSFSLSNTYAKRPKGMKVLDEHLEMNDVEK
jgi:hypothetical protein